MLIWTLEMYLYCLVLMIHTYLNLCSPFGFDLWSCAFYFMYMCILPNLKIYMYNSWVFCLQCKSIHIDSLEFKRYVCIFHVLSKHTYILTYRFCFQWFNKKMWDDFDVYDFLRNIVPYCHFHDAMFHITLVHSLLLKLFGLYRLECLSVLCFIAISWKSLDLFLDRRISY